jgi:mRNA interferase ChpB
MERGDIYLVSLDPTSGSEQQGKRPVLVVSPSAKRTLLPPILKTVNLST